MQQTAPIRHAQRQRNKIEHDGREPQTNPCDKAKGCWTTRGSTTPETTESKQYMESIDANTSATAATDVIQHDVTTHDATTDDATTDYATTDDADEAIATDGNEYDEDAPNAIWSTTTATTVENDVTVRGVGIHVVN